MLDWNQGSIDYYNSKGAVNLTADEGWVVFRYNNKTWSVKHIVVFTNKRSQAKVSTVYFGIGSV